MAFQCVVVTPEQQVLDESLTQAIIPAEDGLLGVLTGRSPLLAKLGIGPLRLDLASGQKKLFLVEGGIAQMKDNKLTILAKSAMPAEQITTASAEAELSEALARTPADKPAAEKRDTDVKKARAKISIAKK